MRAAVVVALLALCGSAADAQSPSNVTGARSMTVNSEIENYLRYVLGRDTANTTPWSLRRFTSAQAAALTQRADSLTLDPWRTTWLRRGVAAQAVALLPAEASVRYNSTYPFGSNDGPIWAGKGATVAVSGGVAGRLGPLSVVIDPELVGAQNLAFPLAPNGRAGALRFGDADYPSDVDHPQRFGTRPYIRLYPGESVIQLTGLGMVAGATTADQWWGPASTFPLILGDNAPGIPSVFIGTDAPKPIGIGSLHARLTYGIETQSAFSPVVGPDTFVNATFPGRKRAMAGLVAVYQPRWIPHLELGGARFFHLAWTGHLTSTMLSQPFRGLLERGSATAEANGESAAAVNNQLASLFFRWVLPRSGFELYSEYGHEDHNYDLRDLAAEPDHSRSIMAGLRKSFRHSPSGFSGLRIEYVDASEPTLGRHRDEGGVYVHTVLRQGHTEAGQLLGTFIGVGSFAGAIVAWDSYSAGGRSSWYVQRTSVNNQRQLLLTGVPNYAASQLSGTAGYERYRIGKRVDWTYAASLTDAKRAAALSPSVNVNLTVGIVPHGW